MRFHLGNKPKENRNIVSTKIIINVLRKTMSGWRCVSTIQIGGLYDHFYKQLVTCNKIKSKPQIVHSFIFIVHLTPAEMARK